MCTDRQIAASVDACRALMGGEFDLQALQKNDPNFSWEFKAVETMAEVHGICGLYVREGVLATIYFQGGMSEEETYLTIGHELGHHFLHMNHQILECQAREAGILEEVAGRNVLADPEMEREAEAFGELLLAKCGIRRPAEANA